MLVLLASKVLLQQQERTAMASLQPVPVMAWLLLKKRAMALLLVVFVMELLRVLVTGLRRVSAKEWLSTVQQERHQKFAKGLPR